jgi:uncharacterized membrane protein
VTVEHHRPKTLWRKIERWMVGIVMAVIAFVIERMVLRSIRKAGKTESKEALHTTLTSKGGEVDVTDGR